MVNFSKKYKNTDSLSNIPLGNPCKIPSGMSGIYRIYNCINEKSYIGQSIDIRHRAFAHNRNVNKSVNMMLYSAIRKYGIENFYISVLALINVDGSRDYSNMKLELNVLETMYINIFNSYNNGYNRSEGGDSGRIGYKHSIQTIEKIKSSLLSKNRVPRIDGITTFCYDFDFNKKIKTESISEMSRITGVDCRSINHICNANNGRMTALKKRFTFSHTDDGIDNIVKYITSGQFKIDLYMKKSKSSKLNLGKKYKKRDGEL